MIHLKYLLSTVFVLCACSAQADHASSRPAPTIADPSAIDQFIDQVIDSGALPFLYVRVEDADGQVAYEHAAVNSSLVPMKIEMDGELQTWFSTLAVFGATGDVTLEELVIESFFPGDDASALPLPFVSSCVTRRFRRPTSPPNLRVSDSTVSWASVAS